MSLPKGLSYRPDIDGLRALAVIAVILYHLDFSFIKGGFVGVDVFLVISGFLITKLCMALPELTPGSYALFILRRLRRLLPGMVTIVLLSCIAAYFILLPDVMASFGKSAAAALLFVSNLIFAREAGYFDIGHDMKPLLHTWSLGVEMQFYLFFPLFVFIARRFMPLIPALGILAALSFIAALVIGHYNPDLNFYLMPTRLWEFVFGALATCLGACLVIAAPDFNAKFFARWRRAGEAAAYTGRISYHLYLFHYPLIVFSLYVLQREMSIPEKLAVIAATFALSVLSYSFIERPIRASKDAGFVRKTGFAGLAAVIVLSVFGLHAYSGKGMKERFATLPDGLLDGVYAHLHPRHAECMDLDPAGYPGNLCRIGAEGKEPDTILWGDSHALMYMPVLEEIAKDEGRAIAVAGYSNCPPVPGLVFHEETGARTRANCPVHNRAVVDHILSNPAIKTVILGSFWVNRIYDDADARPVIEPDYILEEGAADTPQGRAEQFMEALRGTIAVLADSGRHVVLIGPIPAYDFDVPQRLGRALLYENEADIGVLLGDYQSRYSFMADRFAVLKTDNRHAYVDALQALCKNAYCYAAENGRTYYADKSHMENKTTFRLKKQFQDAIRGRTLSSRSGPRLGSPVIRTGR